MRKLAGPACLAVMVTLFLIANRGAYQGYFTGDDLDNIAWTRNATLPSFLSGLLSPRYYPEHFRPVGHLTFHLLSSTAGSSFRPYVALAHTLHLANVLLLFFLARRLGIGAWGAGCGALFLAFPMAVFDALWKPMYLFDLWCVFFLLLALLAYISKRFLLSVLFFWLAYKSKEHAVMLAPVLAAYEYWLGERQWKRLIPFAAIALLFSAQAVVGSKPGNEYALELSLPALIKTSSFYLSRIMLHPYLGLAIFLVPAFATGRCIHFGLAVAALFLAPMLLVPGRLYAAYLYAPLAGLALVLADVLDRRRRALAVLIFAVWLPVNYNSMRLQRRAALSEADERRAYIAHLAAAVPKFPQTRQFIYDGIPAELRTWGVEAALRLYHRPGQPRLVSMSDPNLTQLVSQAPSAVLSWDSRWRKLSVLEWAPDRPEPYLRMGQVMPLWQLELGWYGLEDRFRWIQPFARARLARPPEAREFEVEVNISPQYIAAVTKSRLEVSIDGRRIGAAEFTRHGWQTVRFPAGKGAAGPVQVEFRVEPPLRIPGDSRLLGIAIGGFGFAAPGR